VTDEPMVERLEPTWERRDNGSVYINTHPGGHTAHGAELWLIDRVDALLSQLREQREALERLKALHHKVTEEGSMCDACWKRWPCPTVDLITGIATAPAEAGAERPWIPVEQQSTAALAPDTEEVKYDLHGDVPPHGPGGLRRCGLCDEVWPCSAILSERERLRADRLARGLMQYPHPEMGIE